MSFSEKVIIVTGAASGIGAATALEFAKLNATLALTDRNDKALTATALKCKEAGSPEVLEIVAELKDLDQVKGIIQKTIDRFEKLNVLCNVAGILKSSRLAEETPEHFAEQFDINTKHVFFITQAAMPYLLKSKGCVVNVSSINSTCQFPNSLTYSMTKSAIDQFTKTIALEYSFKGVRVNAVNPGETRTNVIGNNCNHDQEQMKMHYDNHGKVLPMKSVCMPSDIADAIVFLASDKARMITGQCLIVDGGESMLNEGCMLSY